MKKLLIILLVLSYSNSIKPKTNKPDDGLVYEKLHNQKKQANKVLCFGESIFVQSYIKTSFKQAFNAEEVIRESIRQDSLRVVRRLIAQTAKDYLGVPYHWGGQTARGFDCSAFVRHVYEISGMSLPRISYQQSEMGIEIPLEQAATGDILFFGKKTANGVKATHLAIVIKNTDGRLSMIHASRRGVIIDNLDSESWEKHYKKRFLFTKRIIG